MQRCAFTPYEGKKPYIFVSYAHKDSHLVFPILEELDRQGYRVWYDDGIAPGSEWPENIAQHLDGCSVTLAFISPNSIASANCRREVTFALSKHKPFLGIVLEPTEMSLGMEMQLSAQQCIMKYTYTSDADFFRKVCSCPDLLPCLGEPKAAPATSTEPVKPVTPAPFPKVQQEKKPLDKKLIGILAGAAAAVVALAVVLIIVLSGGGDGQNADHQAPQNPQGTTASKPQNDTQPGGDVQKEHLYYEDKTITAEDVSYINQQTNLLELKMYNCVIANNAFAELNLPSTLTVLVLEDCVGVSNLQSLQNANKLMSLKITNCGISDEDLPELSSKELWDVDVSGNPEFTDLGVFYGCTGLYDLNFANTGVSSLDALFGMKDMARIIGDNTKVKDLTVVAKLTELTEVSFANCGIKNIDVPFESLHLEIVNLSGNLLVDADWLTNCTALRCVDLSYNDMMYPEKLKKSAATLEELNLSGNPNLYSIRLEFLPECTKMEKLIMDGIRLDDLELIKSMRLLKYLSLVGCYVNSVENLAGMTGLEYLNLSMNNIADISPLASINTASLMLDLSYNSSLVDVSALPKLEYTVLNLSGTGVDPKNVPAFSGTQLILTFDEAWKDPNCMKGETFAFVTMVDCPADQVVAMENRFGQERLTVINEIEAYLQRLEENGVDCTYLSYMFSYQ